MATTVTRGKWTMAPHHALVDDAIWKLVHRRIPQRILLVREPPRHGKSEHLSHWTPAWYLANWPEREVMVTGYGNRFAQKWGRRSRNTFAAIAPEFGTALAPDRQAADSWGTIDGGGCLTAGMGGGIGGEGASLLIVDDLIKDHQDAQSEAYREHSWDWFRSTAWPRLAPDGVCVAIGTSWHREDYQQRMKREFGDEVLDICLPAIAEGDDLLGRKPGEALWPARWPLAWLKRQKVIEGQYFWNALYQQRPSQHEQAEWPDGYFGEHLWVDELPRAFEHCVIAIDPARGGKHGDYCPDVLVGWHGQHYYVIADVLRRPVEAAAESAVAKALRWDVDLVHVEGNGGHYLAANEVRRVSMEQGIPQLMVLAEDSKGNKEDRIRRLGPRLFEHQLRFVKCAGNRLLVEQLKDFPIADHDDGPDALEMAVRKLNEIAREKVSARAGDNDG